RRAGAHGTVRPDAGYLRPGRKIIPAGELVYRAAFLTGEVLDSRSILVIALLWLIVVAVVVLLFVWPRYRRRKLDATPFPREWLLIPRGSLPCSRGRGPAQHAQLHRLTRRCLADKMFLVCAGQFSAAKGRIAIAADACLLLLTRATNVYHDLNYNE